MPEAGRTAARFDKRGVVLCAIAGVLLLTAGAAWAISSHDPWKLREVRINAVLPGDAMGQCENCHTLDLTEGEPNTSYVSRNARTLPQMRAFGGVPASFGCTFCHSDVTDNVYMQNALKDYEFTPAARKHPVGVNVGGTNNNNEYFSSFDSTAQVDQLQCMDCHDAALLNPGGMASYPYHEGRTGDAAPWTGTWNKAANPYALKNVAALGDERENHCVNTCHGDLGAANGATKPRMGHLGWGAYDGTTMYEPRGQALLQSNCGVCHDAHTSTADGLMSDGLAFQTTGVNIPPALPDLLKTAETAITMSDCTQLCHVGRDVASEYRTVGHGKARNREDTANIGHSFTLCTPCHTSAVPHRDPLNPKRFSFAEDTAMAVLSNDGSANGLDDDYDGQVDEADEAAWTQPQASICQGCHSTYRVHGGPIQDAATHRQSASCLDCHDPHGKGVGANIEMIRSTIAGEPTTFQNTADMAGTDDFYRDWAGGDLNGVCDNTACHGRDLAAILADPDINDHTGVQPGDNCTGCHTHTTPSGANSFKPQCDICHGYPPASGGLPDYSQGIGVHDRHVGALTIGCDECHFRNGAAGNTHNEAAWTEPTGIPVPRTHVDVVFNTHGGTVNVNATYSGYNTGTGTMDSTIGAVHTCNNVTCHNPDSSTAGTGLTGKAGAATNNVVSWADAFTTINACTGCHVQSPNTNPDGGSHYKHDNSTGGKGFPCQMCHSPYYDATDTFGTAAGAHGNWALNATGVVNISGTLGAQAIGGTFDDGTNVCSNVYCHGTTLGGGDQLLPVWGPGASRSGGSCGDCHDTDPTTDLVAPNTISTGNHVAHLGAPQGPNTTCTGCHPAYALNGVSHVNGAKDFLNVDDTTVTTMAATDTCNNCHGTSVANAKNATNWATGTFRLGCLECHDGTARSARTGGVIAPQENLYWTTTGHGRPGTTYNATLHGQPGPGYLCTVCHNQNAPHISGALGDTERFQSVADDALDHTSDTSEVCLDCHKVNQAAAPPPVNHLGYDAQAEASVHSGALTGNYNTAAKAGVAFPAYGNVAGYAASPGYQCEACHNPHGTTKLAMVKDTLNGAFGDAVAVPVGAAFNSSSATLAGLDPTVGANDGACDACHRASGNTNAHPDSASGKANNHNYGQECVTCHDHKNSFFAGCSDCHGGNMVGTTRSNYWPDDAVAPDTAGAHAGHVADLAMRLYGQNFGQLLNDPASDARQRHICKYCHGLNPGNDADHGVTANLPAEVSANQGRLWDTADPPALTDAVTYNAPAGTRTCQTAECHYNRTTPGWLSGTAATCTTCHFNNTIDNGALSNSWPDVGAAGTGDHFAHYAALGAEFTTLYGATNTLCVPCHNTQQPATDFSNIVSLASHIDGDRYGDVTIPAAYNDKSEAVADVVGYTPGVTPNENDGTCANVSCHGGSSIGATPAWRDGQISTATVTTAECLKCHQRVDGATNPLGTEYNDARSGAHVDHDHGCQACHSAVPAAHYAGIATSALDNPTNIGNVTYSVEYTDTTATAVNPLTNGWFNDATTALGVSGTCATVTCHAGASPAWDVDLTATCGLCHLDSPVTNSHQAHVYNGATPDHTDCDQCHTSAAYAVAAAGTDASFISPGLHADGTVNLVAGIGASGGGGAVTCATACHARETTTTWNNVTVPMTCNSCHYHAAAPTAAGNVGTAALGGTHNAHFFGAPANIVCTDCHADNGADVNDKRTHMRATGATDGAVLQNKAAAFQDEADVVAGALGTGTDPDMAPIGADLTSNPTCNTALCHNPSPGGAYSATWNGLPNNSCGFCHADTTGDPASGSHTKHISYAAGYAPCAQCHVDNGATYAHMDRNVDLAVSLTYSASLNPPYDNTSWGSCDSGACHNTDTDPAWGTAVPANSCGVCHVNNNTTPASSSDSPNFGGSDRVASQVGIGDEWTLRGHAFRGLTCASCHDGAGVGHQPDFATSTNPFRLAGYGGSIDAFCSNTTTCHTGAAVPGSNLVVSHTNELMNLDQRTWPAWDPKCVDCHDPHGDAANLKMVATDVFDRGSSAHGVPTATLNAIPRTTDVVDFTVQGGIAVGSYGDTTAGADGICQECHLANDGVATGIASFQDDNVTALAGNHPTASLSPCTQCHKHDKAFEPAGCYGCHGEAVAKQYWPDGAGGAPAYVDDEGDSGSHDAHVLAISQQLYGMDIAALLAAADTDARQKTICAFCHPDPGGATHTVNAGAGVYAGRVDVWFDGQNNGGTGGNYFQVFKTGAAAYGNDAGTNGTYDINTLRCSNVDCHYRKVTPAYGALGWNGGAANAPNCESCHYYRDGAGYPVTAWVAGDLPDAHQTHVAGIAPPNDAQSRNYLCSYCHVVPGANSHTNGDVDLSTAGNPTLTKDGSGADETMTPGGGGLAVKFGVNAATTCTNLYCHGADFGAVANTDALTQGANVAPVWNSHLTGACGKCHDVDTRTTPNALVGQTFSEGKHRTHLRPETGFLYGPWIWHAVGCEDCHGINANTVIAAGCAAQLCHPANGVEVPGQASDQGWASFPSRSHVEGNFEVDFENVNRGFNSVNDYDGTPGTVAALGTAYNNGTDICNRCHSTATVNATIGATLAKVNWNTAAYRFPDCRSCHNTASAAWSNPVSGGVQAPGKELNYDSAGHGKVTPDPTFGGDACVDCHDEDSAHLSGALGQNRTNAVNGQDYGVGANAFCASACHGVTEPVHYANTQTAGGTSDDAILCSTCHDPHGPSGQDAMVNGTIAGRTVSGFADKTLPGSYFNAANQGVCQVCHDPAEVQFHNRTSGAGSTHSPNEVCTTCHSHDATVAFAPRSCESCHNGATPYVKGTATAPNVMGNGTSATGTGGATPKPYDDGSFGFNVNGHGRDDSPSVPGNSINVACTACHDVSLPTGAHVDGVLNGRLTPSDTRTANSFHLLSTFVKASPGSQQDVQVTFDNACYNTCHNGATSDMRHALDAVPSANAAQFGTHGTYTEPQNVPPPTMYYDKHLKTNATYDGLPNFALCVSCHNPHGTNTASPRADLNNKMMLYRWSGPSELCVQCHL